MADSERDEYEAAAREFGRDFGWTPDGNFNRKLASLLRQTAEKAVAEHRHVVVAYIRDRAEQYSQSSGYVSALYDLAADVRDNEPNQAHAHGELDDLMVKRDFKTWKARAEEAERELAASRSESEALRADLDSATVLYAQARAESEALRGRLREAERLLRVLDRDRHVLGPGGEWWWRVERFLASPSSGTREPTNKETTP